MASFKSGTESDNDLEALLEEVDRVQRRGMKSYIREMSRKFADLLDEYEPLREQERNLKKGDIVRYTALDGSQCKGGIFVDYYEKSNRYYVRLRSIGASGPRVWKIRMSKYMFWRKLTGANFLLKTVEEETGKIKESNTEVEELLESHRQRRKTNEKRMEKLAAKVEKMSAKEFMQSDVFNSF
jgi:hypothetical protein